MAVPRFRIRPGIVRGAAAFLVVAAVACEQRPTEPAIEPAADEVALVTLRFEVFDSDNGNQPVPGGAVWLYEGAGEFDLVGIFNDGVSGEDQDGENDGSIEILVEPGQYGAMIKAIPTDAQTLDFVAPVPPLTGLVPVANPFAPIAAIGPFEFEEIPSSPLALFSELEDEGPWACATGPNVVTTTTDLPIEADAYTPTIQADIRSCDFTELDINVEGANAGDALYGVISAADQTILGLGPGNLPLGVDRGVLGFVAIGQNVAAPALASPISTLATNGSTSFTLICPVNANFAVELFQTVNVGQTAVNLVASLLLENGCDPGQQETLVVETARCAVEYDTQTDATFGEATWGYGFVRALELGTAKAIDLTTASAAFVVDMAGNYDVTFTTSRNQGGTLKATAEFTCTDDLVCIAGATKLTGGGNSEAIQLFFSPHPDNAGQVIVEAVLTGIPAHSQLTWSAKGPGGAKIPRPSSSMFTSSAYPFRMTPAGEGGTCVGDSNDGTWSVKGL